MMFSEMRRDNTNIGRNDNLAWSFDTFFDRRTGFFFEVNPIGGRLDGESSNEGQTNFDWNPVWDLAVGRFDGGWIVEAAVPFKSLRYRPGPAQVWGFNIRRTNVWKNEFSYLSPVSAGVGRLGLRPALTAPLVGLEAPPGARNLEIKPYAVADLTTDAVAPAPVVNRPGADIGLDVKYGLTQNLTADFTYNSDFAQVEADELQVNLTRFSLFFPEKREFFLENRRTFEFGGGGSGGDTPVLFYQPAHRPAGQPRGAARGGRADDGPHRRLRPGPAAHSDRRGSGVRGAADRLLGGPAEARRAAPEQRGRARHRPLRGARRHRRQHRVRCRRRLLVLREPALDRYLLGRHARRPGGRRRGELSRLPRLQRRPLRHDAWSSSSSATTSTPRSASCGATTCARAPGGCGFSPRLPGIESIRKLSWSGSVDYFENLAGRPETRETDAEFGIEFENGRSVPVHLHAHLRVSARAVSHRPRRRAAGRRLRLQRRAAPASRSASSGPCPAARSSSTARSTAAA